MAKTSKTAASVVETSTEKSSKAFVYNGVEYKSKTACAVALVEGGMKKSAAAKVVGISPATVGANTGRGLELVLARRMKKRIESLGATKKYSVGEIAGRVGVNTSKVVSILKAAGIETVSAKDKKAAEVAAPKATKKPKAEKKASDAVKKPRTKKVVAPVVAEEVAPVATEEVVG